MNKIETLTAVMDGLMRRYKERVPDVQKIMNAMIAQGIIKDESEIENDHIAFRTLGVPCLGIASLEKIFLYYGYRKMDYYNFPEKKLDAYWYAPPEPHFPRIFISELRVADLTPRSEAIVHSYTDVVKSDPVDRLDLDDWQAVDAFLHSPLWRLTRLSDYEALSSESEYAAWTIYNRYYLNHFTISVHNLKPGYNTIQEFNAFLESIGVQLNDAGGKIKESPDGGLLQSSTVAQQVEGEFNRGLTKMISGSYVEFAERRVLPQYRDLPQGEIGREHRREGFEAKNADKIFESTYEEQVFRS